MLGRLVVVVLAVSSVFDLTIVSCWYCGVSYGTFVDGLIELAVVIGEICVLGIVAC